MSVMDDRKATEPIPIPETGQYLHEGLQSVYIPVSSLWRIQQQIIGVCEDDVRLLSFYTLFFPFPSLFDRCYPT